MKLKKHNNPAVVAALIIVLVVSLAGVGFELHKVQADASASQSSTQASQTSESAAAESPSPSPASSPEVTNTAATAIPDKEPTISLDQAVLRTDPFVAPPPAGSSANSMASVAPLPLSALPSGSVKPLPSESNQPSVPSLNDAANPVGKQQNVSSAVSASTGSNGQSLYVSAIIAGGDHPAAIVEGASIPATSVSVGDQIGAWKVSAITEQSVTLASKGATQTLSLNQNTAVPPTAGTNPTQETGNYATP